ncbi:hypothetical protein [Bosea vaviloviae]|uniref:hypothetical protein n=1 Tax=Bosea vaviloviae TaxID=1526658 RepID=UPI001FCD148B|nr:hypothetical protein [Bosea vaviloviae]
MLRYCLIPAVVFAIALESQPAHACRVPAQLKFFDINHADVVVIGRISNYRIIRPSQLRKFFEDVDRHLSDYARFDVEVEELLVGKSSGILSVIWDNSNFVKPEAMASGPFLIALSDPNSSMPPFRGSSAVISPRQGPSLLTVLQAPCSSAFIFESTSDKARAALRALGAQPK